MSAGTLDTTFGINGNGKIIESLDSEYTLIQSIKLQNNNCWWI